MTISATTLLWVGLGGATGASLRAILTRAFQAAYGTAFPYGTLFVNVLGSTGLGLLLGAISAHLLPAAPWREVIADGLCGGLTTFSTFSAETFQAFATNNPGRGLLNIALNLLLCLAGVAAGCFLFA